MQLAFDADVCADSARVFEILVKDKDIGPEGLALGRGQQFAVGRRRAQNGRQGAGAENGLPARAVGRARAGQVQPRDAGVVDSGAAAQQGLVVAVHIVGHS